MSDLDMSSTYTKVQGSFFSRCLKILQKNLTEPSIKSVVFPFKRAKANLGVPLRTVFANVSGQSAVIKRVFFLSHHNPQRNVWV